MLFNFNIYMFIGKNMIMKPIAMRKGIITEKLNLTFGLIIKDR